MVITTSFGEPMVDQIISINDRAVIYIYIYIYIYKSFVHVNLYSKILKGIICSYREM